jgi:outer membrane protein assembly factor BamA
MIARQILTTLTMASIALSAMAQERFVIERIEVRNAQHASARVIIDETTLREGMEYAAEDVRVGVARVNRLPFLLSADYALEKGTGEGRRVLVINVIEMKRLSILVDGRGLLGDASHRTVDYDFDRPAESNDAFAVRWFAGDRGMFHFTLAVRRGRQSFMSRYTAWEIGYTRYNIFGTRAFATINIRTPVDSVNERRFSPQVAAGVPLTTSQTLSVEYHDTSFVKESLQIFGTDLNRLHAERVITLAWTYDTTDQPFVPSSGTLVRIAPVRLMADRASFTSIPRSTAFAAYAEHTNTNGVDVVALRYWKLSEVNSVSAGVVGGWANIEDRIHPPSLLPNGGRRPTYEIVQAGYSRDLGDGGTKGGSSRIEIEGRFRMEQPHQPSGAADGEHAIEVAANWVWRSVWGNLRLGVGYERVK